FAEGRAFDLVWLPDMRPEESERFIQREEARGPGTPALPGTYEAARALLGDGADDFFASYPFRVAPATDDRPFFHHHFRWGALTQILRMGALGVAHLEFGYALAVAFLLVAAALALVGTFAPILAAGAGASGKGWAAGIGYFFAIGLAYMMVEMTTMLRIERAVGHPVLAMATTVAGFLFWSGLGSLASDRIRRKRLMIVLAGGASAVLCAWSLITAGADAALAAPPVLACGLSFLGLSGAAFAMGMMFPAGLAVFAGESAARLAWYYGVGGFASVLAGSGTVLLAMEIGTRRTLLTAAALYGAAAAIGWLAGRRAAAAQSRGQES
ncbi:MAG: hypothetical protein V2A58_18085, partial [Planctomycetota bacterium]